MLRSSRLLVSRSMAHLALLLSAASLPTSSGILPFAKSFDSLVAYYVFDDGAGFDLKESVSNVSNAGRVLYESKHQTVNYTQPNWSEDEYFGTVIACGSKDTEQKDTLELADVDYADASGAFTINVWSASLESSICSGRRILSLRSTCPSRQGAPHRHNVRCRMPSTQSTAARRTPP